MSTRTEIVELSQSDLILVVKGWLINSYKGEANWEIKINHHTSTTGIGMAETDFNYVTVTASRRI